MAGQADHAQSDGDSSSASDLLDMRHEEGWEDIEDDTIPESFVSLFDSKTFTNLTEMFEYCKEHYNFDVWQIQKAHGLDFLGLVKLVNYVRDEVKSGNKEPDVQDLTKFSDDLRLMPVLEDDAVLYSLEDVLQSASQNVVNEVDELREQLANVQAQFLAYRDDVQKFSKIEVGDDEPGPSKREITNSFARIDEGYFSSYSYNTIHESMLKDTVRTDAYRDFIYENKNLFKDKVVLDVGCGTGILSMFCAKAGAKRVVAVDNSAIIEKAQQNIKANGLESVITCIQGKIEDVVLPVDKVDIIVSEWMGYCLLFESMLDSVIHARDKYLAADGLMVPSNIDIKVAPLADSELKTSYIDFWKDVYGFDMTAMLDRAHEEALVRLVDSKELCADASFVLQLDLHTVTVIDLNCTGSFKTRLKAGYEMLEGFVLWFDTFFMPSRSFSRMTVAEARSRGYVAFSTGPAPEQPTHWQQSVCLIKEPKGDLAEGDLLEGQVTLKKRDGSHRALDVGISWTIDGAKASQEWFLE